MKKSIWLAVLLGLFVAGPVMAHCGTCGTEKKHSSEHECTKDCKTDCDKASVKKDGATCNHAH